MRTTRFNNCVALLLLSAGFWIGCAARVVDDSKLQYLAPEFTYNSLSEYGLSLLPVVAGEGQEGLRRPLASKLEAHLATRAARREIRGGNPDARSD